MADSLVQWFKDVNTWIMGEEQRAAAAWKMIQRVAREEVTPDTPVLPGQELAGPAARVLRRSALPRKMWLSWPPR